MILVSHTLQGMLHSLDYSHPRVSRDTCLWRLQVAAGFSLRSSCVQVREALTTGVKNFLIYIKFCWRVRTRSATMLSENKLALFCVLTSFHFNLKLRIPEHTLIKLLLLFLY